MIFRRYRRHFGNIEEAFFSYESNNRITKQKCYCGRGLSNTIKNIRKKTTKIIHYCLVNTSFYSCILGMEVSLRTRNSFAQDCQLFGKTIIIVSCENVKWYRQFSIQPRYHLKFMTPSVALWITKFSNCYSIKTAKITTNIYREKGRFVHISWENLVQDYSDVQWLFCQTSWGRGRNQEKLSANRYYVLFLVFIFLFLLTNV